MSNPLMCSKFYLLSKQPIVEVKDDSTFPGLRITRPYPEDTAVTVVREFTSADHIAYVSPEGLCGCYFHYEDRSSWDAANEDAQRRAATVARYGRDDMSWVGRRTREAVASFGRYAAQYLSHELTLYATYEHSEGQELTETQVVTPEFFGGASFGPLPEQSLWHIRSA